MKTISRAEKLTYTGSLLGQNMIYSFVTMYVMFFFTDLLRIPSQSVTIIMVVASLWDAINDILMGMIADRTKTRFGKFRPYLLAGPIVIAVTTVMCFYNFGGSPAGTITVAAVSYVMWGMSYTVYDIPIWAISSVASHNPDEKNSMVTLGKIGGTIGTVIISVGSVALLNAFGGERSASAYAMAAVVIVGSGALLMLLSGFVLRERITPTKGVAFRRNIHTILDNTPLKALMVSLLVVNMVNNVRQVAQMYFAVYVWGDSSYVTYIGLSLVVGMIFGMAISPTLIRRFDKKYIFITSCLAGAVFSFVPFVVGGGPMLGLILLGISFAFTGMTTISSTSMLMDAIDYAEHKLGFRGEGIVFSMNTFLNKLSSTIAKGLLGVSLTAMNYVDNMDPNETVQMGFSAIVYVVPAVCFLLAILPLIFYRLKPAQIETIRTELENRHIAEK